MPYIHAIFPFLIGIMRNRIYLVASISWISITSIKHMCVCSHRYIVCVHAYLCLTLCDPMDCNPPCSSLYGILQARMLDWVSNFLLHGIFLTQGLNQCLLSLRHWQVDSFPLGINLEQILFNPDGERLIIFLFSLYKWSYKIFHHIKK